MKYVVGLVSVLWGVQALAQQVSLEGPATAEIGELVILDASAIPASGRDWQAINVPENSFTVVDEGQRLVFATAKPGRYWFTFSYTDDVNDLIQELSDVQRKLSEKLAEDGTPVEELVTAHDLVTDMVRQVVTAKVVPHSIVHELVITGVVPDEEERNVEPVIPEGKYKLALLSRAEALKLPDLDGLSIIAEIYREIAGRITRGELKSKPNRFGEEITTATGHLLAARLTSSQVSKWTPWAMPVSQRLVDLQKTGDIATDGDLVVAYEEIALGLSSLNISPKPEPPKPEPNPPEPAKSVSWVVVIEETADRTPAQAKVLADLKWWQSLETRNIKWRHYDEDSDDAEVYKDTIRSLKLPAVVLLSKDGQVIAKFELPSTTAELERKLK